MSTARWCIPENPFPVQTLIRRSVTREAGLSRNRDRVVVSCDGSSGSAEEDSSAGRLAEQRYLLLAGFHQETMCPATRPSVSGAGEEGLGLVERRGLWLRRVSRASGRNVVVSS